MPTQTNLLRDAAVLAVIAIVFAVTLPLFGQVVGFASPWFGIMVMLDVLGLIAFSRPLFLLRLPTFLRKVRAVESRGDLYKALRVPAFGMLLRRTALRHLNPMVYLAQHRDDPSFVAAQAESAEAAHFIAAAVLVPHTVLAGVHGQWRAVAWLIAAQVGFNLYPILHLRWVRVRLDRLLLRKPRAARPLSS